MTENLMHTLSIGAIDEEELVSILGDFFPRGSGNTETVEYEDEQEVCAITLKYKGGRIVSAVHGPALTKEILAKIVEKIKSAILTKGIEKINRSFFFSYEKIEGSWKYKDQFQILPAPPEAPRPSESYAAHPAVLELSYSGSPDRSVEHVRILRKQHETRLLLHLFVNGGITWENVMQGKKKWAFIRDGDELRSEWLQLGYTAPGFQATAKELSNPKGLQVLKSATTEEYFSRWGVSTNPLEVPANLTSLFDAFYELSPKDREKFLRACFWYYTAGSASEVTPALQYNCLVTAIETLMGEAEKILCDCCGKDTSPGPTGKFKSFLETYAPGDHNNKDRGAFYALRSKLSHGGMLFRHDLPRALGILHPTEIREWDSGGNISRLARIGLINWMMSHVQGRQPIE
jgi:hypothetical protein